jgi:tripartite motif-containing protein 71
VQRKGDAEASMNVKLIWRRNFSGPTALLAGAALSVLAVMALSACSKFQTASAQNTSGQNTSSRAPSGDSLLSGPLKFIASWGTRGTSPGQFQSPEWLAIDGTGNVFVADADAKAIEKFTFDGHPLMSFNDAAVAQPFRVAVDSGGGIYALSRAANSFYIFSPEGEPFRHFPVSPPKPNQKPDGITVDSSGDIFILVDIGKAEAVANSNGKSNDKSSGKSNGNTEDEFMSGPAGESKPQPIPQREIRAYSAQGHFIRSFGLGANPADKTFSPGSIGAGPDGNLYVVDVTSTRVEKFSSDGKMIAAWGGQPPSEGVPGNPISAGVGVAVNAKYVFTAEPLNRGVRVWNLNGDARIVDNFGGRLQSTTGKYVLAVSPKDELVVLDTQAASIYRFHIDF